MFRIITTVLSIATMLALQVAAQDMQEKAAGDQWNEKMRELSVVGDSISEDDYRLGPGDLIEITVFEVEDFTRDYRISASGNIVVPFLGRVQVSGMTGEELEESFARELTNQGLVKEPLVSVFIKEYRSQPVYVLGAVGKPGQYMITHQLTLLDVLTLAGGLDLTRAAHYAVLQRPKIQEEGHSGELPTNGSDSEPASNGPASNNPSEIVEIDLEAILERGELALNVPIRGGDVIHVPERQIEYYYVVGDVGNPGVFELPVRDGSSELLLTQAVAKAGGPTKTAKMGDGILVRYDEHGSRLEVAVDFSAILKGKKTDMLVQPNDVIFIPGSKIKTIGYGLLGVIPQTVTRTVSGGVIN